MISARIVIPEEILNKPGRLTAEEFAIIKNHTVAGAQMLQDLGQAIAQDEPLLQVAHGSAAGTTSAGTAMATPTG